MDLEAIQNSSIQEQLILKIKNADEFGTLEADFFKNEILAILEKQPQTIEKLLNEDIANTVVSISESVEALVYSQVYNEGNTMGLEAEIINTESIRIEKQEQEIQELKDLVKVLTEVNISQSEELKKQAREITALNNEALEAEAIIAKLQSHNERTEGEFIHLQEQIQELPLSKKQKLLAGKLLRWLENKANGMSDVMLLKQAIDGYIDPMQTIQILHEGRTQESLTAQHRIRLLKSLIKNKRTDVLNPYDFYREIHNFLRSESEKAKKEDSTQFEIIIDKDINNATRKIDPDYVWGILGNVLENAVKFTPEKKLDAKELPLIQIQAQINPDNPDIIDIVVENDGPGFPTQTLKINGKEDSYLNHLNKGNEVPTQKGNSNSEAGRDLAICVEFARGSEDGNLFYENRVDENGEINGAKVTFSIPTDRIEK